MIRLIGATDGVLRLVLPPGRDAAAWHAALTAEISQNLSPAHAQVLARPDRTADGLAWTADGAVRTRYADLPAEGRRALDAAVGAILSDIRRLAESGAAPVVREAWPALREIPDLGHLFAVDGRPVLAAWGHAGADVAGRLARFDDGVPWRATPRLPWGRYGAAGGALAALALAAGFLLPVAAPWLVGKPPACAIVPGQLEALRQQMEADSRGQELRTLLATLTDDIGRRRLLCPIAVLPQVPTPRADLPQERWERRDLGMLEGCWNLESGVSIVATRGGTPSKVRSWRMCFDGRGTGQQTGVLEDGRSCTGPLAASFDRGDALRVTEPDACRGSVNVSRSERLCRRLGDAEAECDARNIEGPLAGDSYSSRFRR